MDFGEVEHYLTGVAVHVASLRSKTSTGCGEFKDLALLADWCSAVGIDLVQLLPVNDTGSDSSPYGALSAFALHPIYMHLEDVPEAFPLREEIEAFRSSAERRKRVPYSEVLEFKLRILRAAFDHRTTRSDEALDAWIAHNAWCRPYAVYNVLKRQNEERSWEYWTSHRDPDEGELDHLWDENTDEALFYAWVQMHLQMQLHAAAEALDRRNIYLKGDLPILMNVDSADVWAYRRYFRTDHRAGAPPDMFSKQGQNWGFPVYDWDTLAKDDYWWWKSRLKEADKYYHAYRIDHVLGFFRIWRIPSTEKTGLLGFFDPYEYIDRSALYHAGFDDGAIRWLAEPHVREEEIDLATGAEATRVKDEYFTRLPDEPLYVLKSEVSGELLIRRLNESDHIKEFLIDRHRNRALITIERGRYSPYWYYPDTSAFRELGDDQKHRFADLKKRYDDISEDVWKSKGRELLSMMKETTPMLVCAEDLGTVPDCVPEVLDELEILSLKIERWARYYKEPGEPYIQPSDYPFLSVCTPAVHDTSTLRGWWEEGGWDRDAYYEMLGYDGSPPPYLSTELARTIIERNLRAASLIAVFQLQDWFALQDELRIDNPDDERINVPGSQTDRNWTYRIQITLEDLMGMQKFNNIVRELTSLRRDRSTRFSIR